MVVLLAEELPVDAGGLNPGQSRPARQTVCFRRESGVSDAENGRFVFMREKTGLPGFALVWALCDISHRNDPFCRNIDFNSLIST